MITCVPNMLPERTVFPDILLKGSYVLPILLDNGKTNVQLLYEMRVDADFEAEL